MVPQENPGDALSPLADAVRDFFLRSHRAIDRIMTAQGASFARTKLLLYTSEFGPVRSADLASAFGLAPRTVTEALDGLERDGLIRRDPDPLDRRAKRISLTAQGQAVVHSTAPLRRQFLEEVFGVLSPAERDQFSAMLAKLNKRMAEITAAAKD